MKKIILYIVLLLSCSARDKYTSSQFEEIDFSFDDGWKNAFSLKVLKNGESILANGRWEKEYFSGSLSNDQLYFVNSLVMSISDKKLDSFYKSHLEDQQTFKIVITKLNTSPTTVFVYGDNAPKYLNNFSKKIIFLKEHINFQRKDTVVEFSSLKNFYPPKLK